MYFVDCRLSTVRSRMMEVNQVKSSRSDRRVGHGMTTPGHVMYLSQR